MRAALAGAMAGLVLLTGGGCAALVTPNRSVELVQVRPGAYRLDPEHVYALFKVEHLGLSKVVGRFNSIAASLDIDPDNLASLQLEAIIDMSSIDVNNASLERQLKGGQWFDVERHPQAVFRTLSVEPLGDERLQVSGELELVGQTLPLNLMVQFNGGADNILTGKYTLGFAASGELARSDWGIDSLGGLVDDRVELEIHAEFQRQ